MSSRLPGLLLVCGLVAVVGACGFKLRDGNYRLPESWYSIGIKTGGNLNTRSPLVQELSLQLRQRYGARVELAATENLPGIVLLQEYSHNPVSALDRFGRAQEHMLEYIVYYKLVSAEGKDLIPKQRIYLRQEQTYSTTTILAKEQESRYLQQQLHKRAATRIIERLLATVSGG